MTFHLCETISPRRLGHFLLQILFLWSFLGTSLTAATFQYTYDSIGRIIKVVQNDATNDYVYDATGNRLIKTTTLSGALFNQPPVAVTNPNILKDATNVPNTPILNWSPAVDPNNGDAVIYFIYFGTPPVPPLVFSGWSTNWSPGKLRGNTTYYWQVVARDSHNAQTASAVWNFTTANEPPTAEFGAFPQSGWAPLTVNFYDRSFDHDSAIVSWSWDCDSNGTVDSTNRNPTFTYTTAGDYTVKLTVRDQLGATAFAVKTNFVSILGNNILDLTPFDITIESARSARNLLVRYSITNLGTIPVSGIWQWADTFFHSTQTVPSAQASSLSTFYENQSLLPGGLYSRTNLVVIPEGSNANDYLIIKTDGNNQIGEISEANNTLAISLQGKLPDLVPGRLIISGNTVSGGSLQVSYSTTN